MTVKLTIVVKMTDLLLIPLLAFLLILTGTSVCLAQDATPVGLSALPVTGRIETRVGQLLSNGTNTMPVGELRVKTYRLELVRLDKPINMGNSLPPLATAFRIKVTVGTRFPPGLLTLWMDDMPLDAIEVSPTEVVTLIYSRTLPDGAILALSTPAQDDPSDRSTLPEVLQVPSPYRADPSLGDGDGSIIQLRRVSKFIRHLNREVSGVEIQITSSKPYYVGASLLVLQIGDKEFQSGLDGNLKVLRRWLADEDFAELNDGSKIIAKYGFGPRASVDRIVGRLNKSLLR